MALEVALTGHNCIAKFLHQTENAGSISCCGVVKSKRNLKKLQFFMLEIDGHVVTNKGEHDINQVDNQIQLVLDLSDTDPAKSALRDTAQHMRVGAVVRCGGVPKSDRPGSLSMYLQSVDIVRCSPEPDAIMRFLTEEIADAMNVCEVLDCNPLDYQELKALAAGGPSKAKQLKQAVAKHSRTMVCSILSFFLHLVGTHYYPRNASATDGQAQPPVEAEGTPRIQGRPGSSRQARS